MQAESPSWPHGATAAISITMDNMGEAADLNRNLWPATQPIGNHASVRQSLPPMLELLARHGLPATYFIEAWNLGVYGDVIASLPARGIEVAWHAWQHEAWAKLGNECEERRNFARSFGGGSASGAGPSEDEGVRAFAKRYPGCGVAAYRGFRPPGGVVHGERTLKMCREFGLEYISPAAERAALVHLDPNDEQLVVLPFRWSAVDAYYYMDSFAPLREIKGESSRAGLSPATLAERYMALVDEVIAHGGFLSVLFHPFLTDSPERLRAMDTVLAHVAEKREKGQVWAATCEEVAAWIKKHPGLVGDDPGWDTTQWR